MKADESVEAKVIDTLIKFYKKYSERDLEGCMELFIPDTDVTILGTGKDEKRIGLNNIKIQLERDWKQSDALKVEFIWYQVSISGSVAWVITDRITHQTIGGQIQKFPARLTAVIEKRNDKWLIAQLHHSCADIGQSEGESFSKFD